MSGVRIFVVIFVPTCLFLIGLLVMPFFSIPRDCFVIGWFFGAWASVLVCIILEQKRFNLGKRND